MKKMFTILCVTLGIVMSNAQDPAIEWQNTIGGSNTDFLTAMEPTTDGGYILGGYSTSNISGDKTEDSNGAIDIWIVKIDVAGNISWQNTIGGSGDDYLLSIHQTSDGGYIVGAGSDSNISGDKTENSRGGLDYWIIKLDGNGSIIWQKTYGGDQPDFDTYVVETADGGYFVGGYSDSNVSGDKTDPTNGQRDYWVLKLDNTGTLLWQNSIGGSLVDRTQAAFQTADGGYIIGGFSNSPVSGDKTENSQGGSDYWIVKLDSSGSVQWENTIGGADSDVLRDMIQTANGSYLLAGYSKSNISGDKTENSQGDFDYWILQLDTSGTIIWQNTIGGSNIDYPRDIKQLADGTIVIAGWSNSNSSGDKNEDSNGGYDFWLVKLNSSGALISQNSIGGAADESGPYILSTVDGGFVMGGSSDSNTSGDKADDNEGLDDYWIFKTTDAILGNTTQELRDSILIYPNPFQNNITIQLGDNYEAGEVIISNLLGQVVHTEVFSNKTSLDLTLAFDSGIYLLTISNSDGITTTLKVLKQ